MNPWAAWDSLAELISELEKGRSEMVREKKSESSSAFGYIMFNICLFSFFSFCPFILLMNVICFVQTLTREIHVIIIIVIIFIYVYLIYV